MKSVKKLFSEWKVGPRARYLVPIIEIEGRTAAIAAAHLGYKDFIGVHGKPDDTDRKILLSINSDMENTCER